MDCNKKVDERQRLQANWRRKRFEEKERFRRKLAKYGRLTPDSEPERKPDMLVENVLAYDSPGVLAGREKSHKSNDLTELALCLSAAEPSYFLGYDSFRVPGGGNMVVYLNFEGTVWERKDLIRRASEARRIAWNRNRLEILCSFPVLNSPEGLAELEDLLGDAGDGILIVDCLNTALRGSDFSRASVISGHLADIHDVCRDCDFQPLYAHHFKQGRAIGLDALAGAGVEQHVGQWILLNKVGPYDIARGHQRYRMEIGARAGFGGRYALDVTEGHLNDPGGRVWQTVVTPAAEKTVTEPSSNKLTEAVLNMITEQPCITRTGIKTALKRSMRDIAKATEMLVAEGKIEAVQVVKRGNATTGYRTPDAGLTPDSPGISST